MLSSSVLRALPENNIYGIQYNEKIALKNVGILKYYFMIEYILSYDSSKWEHRSIYKCMLYDIFQEHI